MVEIRPTLQTLKTLRNAGMLPPADTSAYDDAKRTDDPQSKLHQLSQLDLPLLNVALLNDSRTLLHDGKFPDAHKTSSRAARSTIYELRERSGAAWRGAGLLSDNSETLWVILAMPHDEFHKQGAAKIEKMRKDGRLGPTSADSKILKLDHTAVDRKTNRIAIIRSMIDALKRSQLHGSPARVTMPEVEGLQTAEMFVGLSDAPSEAKAWDPELAHLNHGLITVELELSNISDNSRDWLLRTTLPFLQPDQTMIETIFRKTLSSLILLPHSKLMQLPTLDNSQLHATQPNSITTPTRLHYTAKAGLTEAYIQGRAVRAVCGIWWVPVGDDHTHNDLPVCEECESERPFAEVISQALFDARPQ